MKCIFCFLTMKMAPGRTCNLYYCNNANCQNINIGSRYKITVDSASNILLKTLLINKYLIEIIYQKNVTRVSILEGWLLQNTVIIPKALEFSLEDPHSIISKIKTLTLFL